jgi:hypothetical protein
MSKLVIFALPEGANFSLYTGLQSWTLLSGAKFQVLAARYALSDLANELSGQRNSLTDEPSQRRPHHPLD